MEDELILDDSSLFLSEEEFAAATGEETPKGEKNETTEIDVDNLFMTSSESVSSEEKDKGQEDTKTEEAEKKPNKNSNSPNTYSSLANALKVEGILSELDDDFIQSIDSAQGFAEAIEKQVESRLESNQKRVLEALNNNVDVEEVKQYEGTINYLNSITDEVLKAEDEQGEELRKRLIYQDYINRGFSKERAVKEVNKSIDSGNDIEDALDALESNKEHYNSSYERLIKEAKEEAEREKKALKKETEQLQKSVLETETPFGGSVKLDKSTRKMVLDNISKPIHQDDKGNYYTALQKYQKENKNEFLHKVGVIFTLTDGFKNMDKLIKGAAKAEAKKTMSELEKVIQNSNSFLGGSLSLMGGSEVDSESYQGWTLDA